MSGRDSTWHSLDTLPVAVRPAAFLMPPALMVSSTGPLVDGLIFSPGAVTLMHWKRKRGHRVGKKVSWHLLQLGPNASLRLPKAGQICHPSRLPLVDVAPRMCATILSAGLFGRAPQHREGGILPFPRKESPGKSGIGSWDTR